jgi:hypothetical protein
MISAIGDSSQLTLLEMIQKLQKSQATSETSATSGKMGSAPPSNDEMEAMQEQMDASVASKLGIDTETFSKIHSEIQTAIQTALSESDGTGDMRSTIDNAVDTVLQNNGIDPAQFKEAMKSAAQELGMPQPGGAGPMGPPPGGGTYGPQGTSTTDSSSQNDLLTQLLDALKSSSTSDDSTETSTGLDILNWLKNLPTGSLTNCYA